LDPKLAAVGNVCSELSLLLATGATVYMDPAPTVQLNNTEAMLASLEAEEEARILAQLSAAVAGQSPRILMVKRASSSSPSSSSSSSSGFEQAI
jgi:hypothetical protein